MRELFAAAACITAMAASLKLAGCIDWSWWWVIGPPAGGLGVAVLMFLRK